MTISRDPCSLKKVPVVTASFKIVLYMYGAIAEECDLAPIPAY